MKKVKMTKVFAILLASIAALLIIAGFFVPPMGVIDGSVMQSVGELMGIISIFCAWDLIEEAIHKGIEASFRKGDTSIEITKNEEENTK